MATIKITGASDDIICINGDIREEFDALGGEKLLSFDDGTVLSVNYIDPGIWKITPVQVGSAKFVKEYEATAESEENGEGYTDIVTLEGNITKIVCGTPL